jgi:hypothetical protein
VRAILGSPPAFGLFQGAIAISNLGGGHSLGLESDYATTYSSYMTIEDSYSIAGQSVVKNAGCESAVIDEEIACLKEVPVNQVLSSSVRYIVQDGTYVVESHLNVAERNGSTASV